MFFWRVFAAFLGFASVPVPCWNSEFAVLFNSYYNGIGDKHPRSKRGLLTRPSLKEVLEWRKNIEARVYSLLEEKTSPELLWLIKLGINHEQQHQELLLTDIQHLFSNNSLFPVYYSDLKQPSAVEKSFKWIQGIDGLVKIGHADDEFYFDNDGAPTKSLSSLATKIIDGG